MSTKTNTETKDIAGYSVTVEQYIGEQFGWFNVSVDGIVVSDHGLVLPTDEQLRKEVVEFVKRKHWLGDQDPKLRDEPEPLTEEEVELLCEVDGYEREDFEDRGDGKFWNLEYWYDFRSGCWMRDEYGHVYG